MSEFGRLLSEGIKSIANHQHVLISAVEAELADELAVVPDTIRRWRRDIVPSDHKVIEHLARACVIRGRVDRAWLIRFLTQARYSELEREARANELFHDTNGEPSSSTAHKLSLPRRPYERFIGRETEIADIQRFLSAKHRAGVICLTGIGGVGKTALALEVAYRACEAANGGTAHEPFDAVIWLTAKQVELLPGGEAPVQPNFTDLDGIYRALAIRLRLPAITNATSRAEQDLIVADLLAEKRILLILDNLENIDDRALRVFLRDLPADSKAIVTTRHRIDVAVPIALRPFSEEEAKALIRAECQRHALTLPEEQQNDVLEHTGRLPLAIVRTIARMGWRDSSVETELRQLEDPANKLYDFCFERSIALVRGKDAHAVFMALAFFDTGTLREAIGYVAGLSKSILERDEALSDLEVLSLINKEEERFSLDPLTKVYAANELAMKADLRNEARERWVQWHLNYARENGGKEWTDWFHTYDKLEAEWENILAVLNWCAREGRYEDVVEFWLRQRISDFANLYGYWEDRIKWYDWLIAAAEQRGDLAVRIEACDCKSWTLALKGNLEQLEGYLPTLEWAWNLRSALAPKSRVNLARNRAYSCLRLGLYEESLARLEEFEREVAEANLTPRECDREFATSEYYRAEILFRTGDLEGAKRMYERVIELAQRVGWQRAIYYSQNWLAEIAIQQRDFDEAEKLLQIGLPVAERNKDRRRIPLYLSAWARLELARGNYPAARRRAEQALDRLKRLNMQPEAEELRALFPGLNA